MKSQIKFYLMTNFKLLRKCIQSLANTTQNKVETNYLIILFISNLIKIVLSFYRI